MMNKSNYTLTNHQLHEILKRFYDKFYLRRKGYDKNKINPNKLPNIHNLNFISAYKKYCSYTGKKEYIYKKHHIIIKYKLLNLLENGSFCLNILYEDYMDLLEYKLPSIT